MGGAAKICVAKPKRFRIREKIPRNHHSVRTVGTSGTLKNENSARPENLHSQCIQCISFKRLVAHCLRRKI